MAVSTDVLRGANASGKSLEDVPEPYKTVIREVPNALRKVFGDRPVCNVR